MPTIASRALDGGPGARAPLPTLRLHPTGKSVVATKTCLPPSQKIFHFRRRANQFYQLAPSFPDKRGASRSSRTRDGMRWTRQRWRAIGVAGWALPVSEEPARGRTALQRLGQNSTGSTWSVETLVEVAAYGEVVWSWHPLLMPSLAEAKPAQPGEVAVNPQGDGDKKEFVAEESTKETVKTIARGKPGDFRRNRGDYRVLTTNAHGLRVLRAPGFPCSLFLMGTM